jgi:hypothetical protein
MARNKMHASLGFLAPLKGSMNEFVGAGIGVAGALGLKWALKQSWMSWAAGLPDPILKLAPSGWIAGGGWGCVLRAAQVWQGSQSVRHRGCGGCCAVSVGLRQGSVP